VFIKSALIGVAVLLGAFGQVFMKIGMTGRPSIPAGGAAAWYLHTVFSPYVFAGLMLYFISSLFWLTLLRWFELSFVYPLIATGYIVVMVLSYILTKMGVTGFNDHITWVRVMGVLLICAGVAFIAQTAD
jgi:drug/metabolite transporter (DMT)-like permease